MFGFLNRNEGIAVRHQDGTLTYPEFNRILALLRARLEEAGARPGDRVALVLPNSLELLAGYYACLLGGFVAVPVNARLTPPEVERILRHSSPQVVLTYPARVSEFEESWRRVEGLSPSLEILGLEKIHSWVDSRERSSAEEASPEPVFPAPEPAWPPEHPAILFYTGGTTGEPKGALYSHRTLRDNCRIYAKGMQITGNDHSVLCHCMASNFIFAQMTVPLLHLGGTVEVVDFGSVEQTLCAIEGGATFLSLIPWFGFQLIEGGRVRRTRAARRNQTNRLRACAMGGDRIPLKFFQEFKDVFGILPREHLGMTETNVYVVNPQGEENIKVGSVGTVLEEVELEIRDGSGAVLPPGESGEIWVRTPAAIEGYWNDPEKTSEAIVDGWFCTGDVGHFDESGYLWFFGRTKHLILCDGDNLHPREIENEINRHPSVALSSVFGVPHPTRGETVGAAVILGGAGSDSRAEAGLSLEELAGFLRDRISDVKIPQHLLILESFPQTPIGKVDRKALLALVGDS